MARLTACPGLLASLVVAMSAQAAPHGRECIRSTVALGRHGESVYWNIAVPRGAQTLDATSALPVGYSLQSLWRPQGRARVRIHGNTVEVASGDKYVTLKMSVGANRLIPDRTYAPYFRFSDGSIALLSADFRLTAGGTSSSCLTFAAPEGGEVIWKDEVSRASLRLHGPQTGYVVLGAPARYVIGRQVIVQDRSLPAWIGQAIRSASGRIARTYSSELGERELPVTLVFATHAGQAAGGYHGDTLPDSITLDFSGRPWAKPQQSALAPAIGLLAHELFHVWNADYRASGVDRMLVTEGGAELARELVESELLPGRKSVLDGVSDALNRCRDALDPRRSLRLQLKTPGRLPYDCGMPFVLAAVSAGRGSLTPRSAFFSAWRAALGNAPRGDYSWEGLIARGAPPSTLPQLRDAVSVPGAYGPSLDKVLLGAGYRVSFERDLSRQERVAAAGKLMQEIMASNCHGESSFYVKPPEGFLLAPLPTSGLSCASLSPNEIVSRIHGQSPWSRPIALSEKVARACAKRGYVEVSLAERRRALRVACGTSVRAVPRPVRVRTAASRRPPARAILATTAQAAVRRMTRAVPVRSPVSHE